MGWFENLYSTDGKFDLAKAATSAAGLATLYGAVKPDSSVGEFLGMSSAQQPVGYTGGIPEYEISREVLPGAFAATTAEGTPRRPGSMGRRYFTDTTFTPTGGVMEAGSMPAAQTTTPTTQGLLGQLPPEAVAGLLGALTGIFGGGAGATPAGATPAGATPVSREDTMGDINYDESTIGITPPVIDNSLTPEKEKVLEDLSEFLSSDDTTTTDDAAYNNFVSGFYNKELTKDNLLSLANSGYDISRLADTLSVDADALSNAISAAQTQSIFDAVDPSDGFSDTEAASIANLILEGRTGIGNVAEQYGLDDMDVIAGLFKGGYEAPAEIIERIAANNPGLTEVQLMENLLAQGRATPEEIAAYYSDNAAYPQYAGITAADIRAYAKERGIEGFAAGGMASLDGMGQGYYLGGPTDGMADLVPATIDGAQPAALSDGEFVVPADVVSHLGNGNSDAGAKQLYSMMDRVRTERTGTTKQGPEINPTQMMPA